MAFGAVKILDLNGLSYLYTKLRNNIDEFQTESKSVIDAAASAANTAADRANSIVQNADVTYATKQELADALGGITSFNFSVVSSLPTTGQKGIIYLVANSSGNQTTSDNGYDEYIWINSKYEKIGTTSIDLSQYLTTENASSTYLSKTDASSTYATKGEVKTVSDTLTGSYQTKTASDAAYAAKSHTHSDYLPKTEATKVESSTTNGKIKINGKETTVYTHPSGTNPHGTTKSDVGLGKVGNFKAVSTVASQGLSDTEKSNARANIGAGTSSLTIGTTSTTAAAGNHTHSNYLLAANATKVEASTTNGNVKINGTETKVYTHPSGTNPHGTTKSDVGLGNVGNFKAVSTVASQGLSDTEKSNARANIGAGTSSLTIGTTSTTAAAGNHTHNYAGSSSAGGVATSASKLATARTITISGAVSGSASFDGSSNITISTTVQSGTSAPSSLATGALYAVYE